MAKTKIEVDLLIKDGDSVDVAETKTKSLKAQLKEMKALLASGTLDAGAFNKLAAEAGALQDQIADVSQRVKNLASDSQKLDGFLDLTQGIVGGFAAVQGITALVAGENEDLQKTMVKLQAAMSALAGIQAVANALNKDSAAMTALVTIKTQAQIATQRIYTFVTGQATAATAGFKAVLTSLGVVAVIGAIVGMANAMGLFGDETSDTTDEIDKQKDAIDKLVESYDEWSKKVEKLEGLQAGGLVQLKSELALLKAKGASQLEIFNKEQDIRHKELGLLQGRLNELTNLGGKEIELIEIRELRTAKLNEIEAAAFTFQKKLADDADAFNKARNERIAKQKKDESLRDFQQNLEDEAERKEFDEWQKERDKKKREDALTTTYNNMQEDLRLKRLVRERDQKEREDELRKIQANEAAKVAIAQGTFDTLTNLGEIFIGEQFRQTAIGKILALTQIAIDTARAISSLVAASEANPTNAVTYGLAGAAQFVAGLARITGNVLQAKRVLNGGGIGGNSGGGSPSSSIPNSQPPSSSSYSKSNQQNQPGIVKVVIMENEMTTTQGRVLKIRENAEII